MKSNVTLVGMPGAGKSTTGVILAKLLSFGFMDTDLLIQQNRNRSLQDIVDKNGYIYLRKVLISYVIYRGQTLKIFKKPLTICCG